MSTHCFKRLLGLFLLGTAFSLAGPTPANAFTDVRTPFELDGNLKSDTKTDWVSLFDVSGDAKPTTKTTLPTGFGPARFFRDFVPGQTDDDSTFTQGGKDTLNITPDWKCVTSSNVTDKGDVLNAYATVYVDPTTKDTILYFALEVSSNEGTKSAGFWFLKDPTTNCLAGKKATNFTGVHLDGDIMIVAEYSSGGTTNVIRAYRWDRPDPSLPGSLNTTPFATGADCSNDSLTLSSGICGKTNAGALLHTGGGVPWLTQTKPAKPQDPAYTGSTDLDKGMFLEGGINLTQNNIEDCFNGYLASTRSSVTLNSTIYDYVLGDFITCKITASKACSDAFISNTAGTQITSPFTVTIKNDGPGTVYDVTMKEYLADPNNPGSPGIPAGESCKITDINGVTKNIDVTTGNAVKVADSLAKKGATGDTATVKIECTGSANSFQDKINAVAGSAVGKSDITAVDALSAACPLTPKGALEVKKVCRGIDLVPGNPLTLKVNVEVSVKNVPDPAKPGDDQGITITSISDTKVTAFTQVDCTTLAPITADLDLAPSDKACFLGSYTPKAGDVTTPPSPTDQASFSDEVKVEGKGDIDKDLKGPYKDSATCFLCDADNDSFPDVLDPFPNDPNQPNPNPNLP